MSLSIPRPIVEDYQQLYDLIDRNPTTIPLTEAAAYLHMDPESLRCAIDQGRASFGFSWKKDGRGNRGFKLPTVAFYNWLMQGHGLQFVHEYTEGKN